MSILCVLQTGSWSCCGERPEHAVRLGPAERTPGWEAGERGREGSVGRWDLVQSESEAGSSWRQNKYKARGGLPSWSFTWCLTSSNNHFFHHFPGIQLKKCCSHSILGDRCFTTHPAKFFGKRNWIHLCCCGLLILPSFHNNAGENEASACINTQTNTLYDVTKSKDRCLLRLPFHSYKGKHKHAGTSGD